MKVQLVTTGVEDKGISRSTRLKNAQNMHKKKNSRLGFIYNLLKKGK